MKQKGIPSALPECLHIFAEIPSQDKYFYSWNTAKGLLLGWPKYWPPAMRPEVTVIVELAGMLLYIVLQVLFLSWKTLVSPWGIVVLLLVSWCGCLFRGAFANSKRVSSQSRYLASFLWGWAAFWVLGTEIAERGVSLHAAWDHLCFRTGEHRTNKQVTLRKYPDSTSSISPLTGNWPARPQILLLLTETTFPVGPTKGVLCSHLFLAYTAWSCKVLSITCEVLSVIQWQSLAIYRIRPLKWGLKEKSRNTRLDTIL